MLDDFRDGRRRRCGFRFRRIPCRRVGSGEFFVRLRQRIRAGRPIRRSRRELWLPFFGADGEVAINGVVDDGFLEGVVDGAGEGGEDAERIFGGVGGEFFAVEVGHRGEEVAQAGEFVGVGAGGDFAGPADDEGDAVAAVPDVGLVAAELGSWEVAFGASEGFDVGERGSIRCRW